MILFSTIRNLQNVMYANSSTYDVRTGFVLSHKGGKSWENHRYLREVSVTADQVFHVVGHRQAGGRTYDRVQQRPVVRQPYGYDSRLVAGHDLFAVRRHFHRGDRRLMSLSVKTDVDVNTVVRTVFDSTRTIRDRWRFRMRATFLIHPHSLPLVSRQTTGPL